MHNINDAITWISENSHLFQMPPQLPSILDMIADEREKMLVKLEYFHEGYDENLEKIITFIFFTKHDFLLFVKEMDSETWSVNCSYTPD